MSMAASRGLSQERSGRMARAAKERAATVDRGGY